MVRVTYFASSRDDQCVSPVSAGGVARVRARTRLRMFAGTCSRGARSVEESLDPLGFAPRDPLIHGRQRDTGQCDDVLLQPVFGMQEDDPRPRGDIHGNVSIIYHASQFRKIFCRKLHATILARSASYKRSGITLH